MPSWILKVSDQRLYADVEGVRYEYDKRHSVRVRPGDGFVYVDKRDGGYRFTGADAVCRVDERPPTGAERDRSKVVRAVYAAELAYLVWFDPPFDISTRTAVGRQKPARAGDTRRSQRQRVAVVHLDAIDPGGAVSEPRRQRARVEGPAGGEPANASRSR